VIIPHIGPPSDIERCLRSLTEVDAIRSSEVIVVHSGALPGATAIHTPPGLPVRVLYVEEPLVSGLARNLGAAHAHSKYLVFLDADCTAGRRWLLAHLDALSVDARVTTGPVLPGPTQGPWGIAEYLIEFAYLRRRPWGRNMVSGPACNMAITRADFERLGGFSSLRAGQDLLLHLQLRARAVPLTYVPGALMYHWCREESAAFGRHREAIGAGLGVVTRIAEREALLGPWISAEYRFLHWIAGSPFSALLVPSKLWRLFTLVLRGDGWLTLALLRTFPHVLIGLAIEARACRHAYVNATSNADDRR